MNNNNSSARLSALDLNWKVQPQPLWVDDAFGPRKCDKRAVVRQDNGKVLGVVGHRYTPVQNEELAAVADSIASQTDSPFASGGHFGGGSLVYMSLRLPKDIKVDSRDILESYLVLSNPHDGSGSTRVNISTIRPVCKNTLRLAWSASIESLYQKQSLRHTQSITQRLIDIKADLSKVLAAASKFEEQAQLLRNTKPTERSIDQFLKTMGFSTDEAEGRKREEEMAFRRLLVEAPGQAEAGNSLWRLVNGATYYADHAKQYRANTDKEESIAFGAMAEWKEKAFTTALELAGVK